MERDKKRRIIQFQSYKKQSPKLHADADDIDLNGEDYKSLQSVTEQFMAIANDRSISGDALKKRLRNDFFQLAPRAESGGVSEGFGPRP